MKVLVVDDDPVGRVLAATVVEHLGHEVHTAGDGEAAWRLLELEHFDVLVTDREMPGLDGLALAERIRARDAGTGRQQAVVGGAYCYVIILTGHDSLEQAHAGITAGADDYLSKPLDGDALRLRLLAAQRITDLHRQLAREHVELNAIGEAQHALARRDLLTQLPNRLALQEHLDRLDANLRRYGRGFSLAVLDIDHFKAINDVSGHNAGDAVLRQLAGALLEQVRDTDGLYRYGGEEFVFVIETPSSTAALAAVQRLCVAVRALEIPHPGRPGTVVTLSAGVATHEQAGAASQELLTAADAALYQAKQRGRDRTCLHEPAHEAQQALDEPGDSVDTLDRRQPEACSTAASGGEQSLVDPAPLRRLHQLGQQIGRHLADEIVQTWLRQSEQTVHSMQSAVRDTDAAAVRRTAHTLKGSSGTVGAVALEGVCLRLEADLSWPERARLVRQVGELLGVTNQALQQHLREITLHVSRPVPTSG